MDGNHMSNRPGIYAIWNTPAIGWVSQKGLYVTHCKICGAKTSVTGSVELNIDVALRCNLFESTDGEYFITDKLRDAFVSSGIRGVTFNKTKATLTHNYALNYRAESKNKTSMPDIHHMVVCSKCDGPWVRSRGKKCTSCGIVMPNPDNPTNKSLNENTVLLVDFKTWNGEDVFLRTEPGPLIVTERVIEILQSCHDLDEEPIEDRATIQKLMPKYAQLLEAQGWMQRRCSSIGPAAWVGSE